MKLSIEYMKDVGMDLSRPHQKVETDRIRDMLVKYGRDRSIEFVDWLVSDKCKFEKGKFAWQLKEYNTYKPILFTTEEVYEEFLNSK